MKKPVMLIVMDGWGINENLEEKNAIREASPQNLLALEKKYPHTRLQASGEAVGLPEGQMGNSEVGHLNIGAGRVVYQELTRINRACRLGEVESNQVLCDAMDAAKAQNGVVHFMGLLSDGGVHSNNEHLYALV